MIHNARARVKGRNADFSKFLPLPPQQDWSAYGKAANPASLLPIQKEKYLSLPLLTRATGYDIFVL